MIIDIVGTFHYSIIIFSSFHTGLTISNGSMIETLYGSTYPDKLSLKGPLEINFVAGENDGYAGFELDYTCEGSK